uniref:Interleukin 20 receptor subunit beta n=1 Tax=Apteryx owenii TaxID=8824 RepID=A0A8B9PG84_APTOW
MVKEISSTLHLDTMEAGTDYCVKAQTYVEAINRSSNFSQMQCVRAQGNSQLSFLFLLLFAVAALTLPFLAWKTSKIFQYSCCPIVVLPDTLVIFLICLSLGSCEAEHCDLMVHVMPSEEVLRLWIQETL